MSKDGRVVKVLYAPVSNDLHKEAKIRAVREGRSVGSLVADAVEDYLHRPGAMSGA